MDEAGSQETPLDGSPPSTSSYGNSDDSDMSDVWTEEAVYPFSSSSCSASTTPPTWISQMDSRGPVFQLSSSLMAQLPIKRGLSRWFQGKSQSFTLLADARYVEDLAKKEAPNVSKRRKTCKSTTHARGTGAGRDAEAVLRSRDLQHDHHFHKQTFQGFGASSSLLLSSTEEEQQL